MRVVVTLLVLIGLPGAASGQLRGIKAEVTPLVAGDAPIGGSVKAAVQVRLPETLHVQSNKPRDPSLIPTVLTIDAPAGVRVTELVFPKPRDLAQQGQEQPLAVFDHEFAIGVALDIDEVKPGELVIPARLRYQACDDKMCFPPSTGQFAWTLRVVPSNAQVTAQHQDVIAAIPFGSGEPPSAGDLPPGFPAPAEPG